MRASEVRRSFLDFFAARGHRRTESAPLVPADDPTLLFTNAGMVPFKDVFTGRAAAPPERRAVSCQRCVRAGGKHNDLENVGRTPRHHTFFEMLGNFSFGDYFKAEAVAFAWEFLTRTLDLAKDRLLASVHPEDDEAAGLWRKVAGLGADRIVRDPENFWQMGETGPCGPCSEIHWRPDRGEPLEVWNLVFMQFDRSGDGRTAPLPAPSIDTGMGLERIAAILQGVPSNFDVDHIRPLIAAVEEATGRRYGGRYGDDAGDDVSLRVIADHVRAATFLVADGVVPSNEGRGYVLRRILRRAIRHARRLGAREPTLHRLVPLVEDLMAEAYPYLRDRRRVVEEAVRREEETFLATIDRGLAILEEALASLGRGARLDGAVAFRLYDTYGFPLDLTETIAEERGIAVEREGFDREMEAQRARSKAASRFEAAAAEGEAAAAEAPPTEFVGTAADEAEARVIAVARVVEGGGEDADLWIVLDRTPFYAEGGGQVADTGVLEGDGWRTEVLDVRKDPRGVFRHRARVEGRAPRPGDRVVARIDAARRRAAERHHTATHLLHAALRGVLGPHVGQAGSLVEPGRLRFDFTHPKPLAADEVREIERRANEAVLRDIEVRWSERPIEEARRLGALAFFGEKYGDRVRVVEVGDVSREFCGGTHVRRTGEIGLVKVVAEGGVAAGVRRIEAVAGEAALEWAQRLQADLAGAAARLSVPPEEVERRIADLQREVQAARREAAGRAAAAAREALARAPVEDLDGLGLVVARIEGADVEALRTASLEVARRVGRCVVVAAGDASLVVQVAPEVAERVRAGEIVKELGAICGARGGGRAEFAQAGGADPARLAEALRRAPEIVRARLGAPA